MVFFWYSRWVLGFCKWFNRENKYCFPFVKEITNLQLISFLATVAPKHTLFILRKSNSKAHISQRKLSIPKLDFCGARFFTELLDFRSGQHRLAPEYLRAKSPMSQQFPNIDIDISRLTILKISHISNSKKGKQNQIKSTVGITPSGLRLLHLPHRDNVLTHFSYYRLLINTLSIIFTLVLL